MSYNRKNSTKVLGSILGLVVVVALAIWQFYLFVTFRNASGSFDVQGGTHHLWWAIIMAVFALIAGFFVLSVFVQRDADDELHITS